MTWHRPRGSLAVDRWAVSLSPAAAEWSYSGLHVLTLQPGESEGFIFEDDEILLVPLRGSFEIVSDPLSALLRGRPDPFHQVTDRMYLPPGTTVEARSGGGGELAVCTARADAGGPPLFLPAADTSVEVRGGGQATRQVNGLLPDTLDGPERLIVVEVITPAGNWSSYPPHKHDESNDVESRLEEIYYFRIAGDNGFGFHRTYTTDGSVDETVKVEDGDIYLIPEGYHGPCAAAPGYDMYYLNVMAGDERVWCFSTDPAHEWLVQELANVAPDPRLPRA